MGVFKISYKKFKNACAFLNPATLIVAVIPNSSPDMPLNDGEREGVSLSSISSHRRTFQI